jgi:UDP-glucose 4-epimerase
MKILITGSSGYVGNFLVEHFASLGHEVVACDVRELPRQRDLRHVRCRKLDVTDRDGVTAAFREENPDRVLHLAYLMDPQHDGEFERRVDVDGSMNVLAAVQATPSVKQLLTFSSTSAYGAKADNPDFIPETTPLRPNDYVYGIHKKAVEEAWLAAEKRSDLKLVFYRMCTAVGPSYYKAGGLVATFAKAPFMPLIGGGRTKVQWIHEDDVKALTELIVNDSDIEGIYNLVPEDFTSSADMAKALHKRTLYIPVWLISAVVRLLWALRVGSTSPPMVRLLRYGIVASPRKLQSRYGYHFKFGSLAAFLDAVEKRKLNGTL